MKIAKITTNKFDYEYEIVVIAHSVILESLVGEL